MTTASCSECGQRHCYRHEKSYPPFCLGEKANPEQIAAVVEHLRKDNPDSRMALASAEIESLYYGRATRVEEVILFAKQIGAKRIGIATCMGLIEETRLFSRIVQLRGLEAYSVACKVGSVDKTEIGFPEELKLRKGFEAMCNPILQAKLLNEQKTDLNVIIGLCIGHDSLFSKYSDAPVTTLIVKDRALGNNPAAALYVSHSYFRRVFDPGFVLPPKVP